SVPRTPQQNGIAERKNRTLIEAARTLLAYSLLHVPFWAEAVNTACYVQNRVTRIVQETLHVNFMENKLNVAGSGPAREQGDKAVNKDKGKSPAVTITRFGDLNEEFAKCINNSSNGVSAAGPSVSAAGLEFTNSTNVFTTAGPLVSAAELNFTNITNDVSATGPSNAAMPNLEDLSHNADDVGAEA
nr:putative ribonuclease H-like domain-containing protein [Tanacetum cinerariifolium]